MFSESLFCICLERGEALTQGEHTRANTGATASDDVSKFFNITSLFNPILHEWFWDSSCIRDGSSTMRFSVCYLK
jgi:hypothetical protein